MPKGNQGRVGSSRHLRAVAHRHLPCPGLLTRIPLVASLSKNRGRFYEGTGCLREVREECGWVSGTAEPGEMDAWVPLPSPNSAPPQVHSLFLQSDSLHMEENRTASGLHGLTLCFLWNQIQNPPEGDSRSLLGLGVVSGVLGALRSCRRHQDRRV